MDINLWTNQSLKFKETAVHKIIEGLFSITKKKTYEVVRTGQWEKERGVINSCLMFSIYIYANLFSQVPSDDGISKRTGTKWQKDQIAVVNTISIICLSPIKITKFGNSCLA